jgi:ATP-dependent RNA helicase DDX24/MAK5
MGMKRGRESRGSTNKSKKKQRVEKVSSSTHADADETHSLGIDELNWKEVQLPDRLEDAEGFFGLEEIEGVDIVRAEGHGEIRFRVGLLLNPSRNQKVFELSKRAARRKHH